MRSGLILVFSVIGLSACTNQLPSRTDGINVDSIPILDPTLIPSNNGLLSAGITAVPGSYCIAGADGKCSSSNLSPAQCLLGGANVEVAPKTNPTPSYDALIDNKYTATLGVPFVYATGSAEQLDEVKALISGTAEIAPSSPNNGYPGVEGLKACILRNNGPGNYGTVFWISAANIIDVTIQHFQQVSSTDGVTAMGFGLNGTTYNHNGINEEKVWIGLQASAIQIGTVAPPVPGAHPASLTATFALPLASVVRLPNHPEPVPPVTKQTFVSQ